MKTVEIIVEYIKGLSDNPLSELNANSPLIGAGKVVDSRGLVELCLQLEDLAEEKGGEFDWTSESAMSSTKSIFRSIGSLADYFDQTIDKKN